MYRIMKAIDKSYVVAEHPDWNLGMFKYGGYL